MRFIPLVLSLASLAACSSSSSSVGGGAGQQGVDDFCTHNCAKQHTCLADDQSTCVAKCKNDLAAAGPKLRGDYFTGISNCLDAVDCAKWATDSNKCPSVAQAGLAPTTAATNVCNDLVKKEKDCSQPVTDLAKCLDAFKIFSDATIGDASACLAKPCADYGKCMITAVGGK